MTALRTARKHLKNFFLLQSPNALFEKTIFERFLKRKIDGGNHFPFKAPDICWACRLSQSGARTVSPWTTLSWSQGTSFVMFHIFELRCCVFKGQRFHRTHTTCERRAGGDVQHRCHYFFPLGTVPQGLCFLCRSLRKHWADCFGVAVDCELCLQASPHGMSITSCQEKSCVDSLPLLQARFAHSVLSRVNGDTEKRDVEACDLKD